MTMTMRLTAMAMAMLIPMLGGATSAAAQSVTPPGTATVAPVPPPVPPPAPGEYVYLSGGRRDPFVDLMAAGSEPQSIVRGEGAAGLTVSEISITGVVQSRGSLIAVIQAPDKKTYLIHPGDKLADGVVTSVTSQGIIVLQDIQDRLSPGRRREVSKLLRSLEGAKE